MGHPGGFWDVPEARFIRYMLAGFISTMPIPAPSDGGSPAGLSCARTSRKERIAKKVRARSRPRFRTEFPLETNLPVPPNGRLPVCDRAAAPGKADPPAAHRRLQAQIVFSGDDQMRRTTDDNSSWPGGDATGGAASRGRVSGRSVSPWTTAGDPTATSCNSACSVWPGIADENIA